MITKELENKKYCCFYASDFHLEMILLPYIKNKMYKDKFVIFTEKNLLDSMEIFLNRTNLSAEEKNKMINLNWNEKNNNDLSTYNLDNYTIIINGSKKYIKDINQEIEKINPKKVNIIDCYNINDVKLEPNDIQGKYDEVLNTSSYKKN